MTNHVSISIIYGLPSVTQDDIYRAKHAAQDYFSTHNVDGIKAQQSYYDQWEALEDETIMTGIALEFIAARTVADLALTKGWASLDGASCTIEVWNT